MIILSTTNWCHRHYDFGVNGCWWPSKCHMEFEEKLYSTTICIMVDVCVVENRALFRPDICNENRRAGDSEFLVSVGYFGILELFEL